MKVHEYNEMMSYMLRPRQEFGVGGMPYEIFGKQIYIPKISGVQKPEQNKKSVEAGFKKLEKWLTDSTPENWVKTFGKNNAFNYQLRNYLQGTRDIGSVKGMDTAEKVFDAINVKNLLTPAQIKKILDLDTGGKGVSLKSKRAKTFGNLKFTMEETIETIKNFQNGEQWLRRNPDPNKIGPDGKNIYRKYANAIKSMQSEQKKIGGFPYGDNSEKKLWSNLYRASYRGDRIKIVGEFADGNLPINEKGKIDWKMKDKNGVAAWKRVEFLDLQAPKNTTFTWGGDFKRGDFKKQIDNVFGEGFFDKSTAAYDVQVRTGSKRDFTKEGGGRTIKSDLKIALLKNEALIENPKATKEEINDYINKKARRFNITEVHHPDGVGVNPYKTEPTFRYANRALDKEVMQPLKAGNIDINEAKLRIDKINKNIGPIRVKLDDGYYGNYVNTQKSILEAAKKYQAKSLTSIPGVTTADKAPIPEATQTRNMFKNAFKGAGKLGVAAVPAYYLGTGIKREISEGRNPFSMSAQAAETGEQTKEQNPSFIEEYPYLVGTTAAASPLLTKKGRKIYGGVLKGGLKAFGSVPSGLGFSASQFVDINPFSDEFGELQEDPNLGLAGVDLLLPELGKRIPGSSSGILARAGRFALNPFQALEGLGRFGRAGRIAAMGARIPSLMTPVGLGLMGIEGVMMGMREQERINQMRETDPEAYQEFIADQEDMLRESAAYGGRMGFDEGGPSDPSRRKFMKIMGGLASLPVVGKFFRVAEQTPVVQNIFTEIQKLKNSQTIMPDWFPTFLDKFRREGVAENIFKKKKVEVSKAEYDKAFAEGRGKDYYTDVARTQEYKANNPDHMDYFKYEDTDELIGTTYTNEKIPGVKVDDFDGEVSVNWENDYSQPVSIEYVKPGIEGTDLGRLDKYEAGFADKQLKPEGEFAAVDQEVYATDPDGGYDTNAIIVESLDDMMEGTTRVMEEYATGKPVRTLSKGEGKVIEAEIRAEQAAESAAEMADDFDDF